jgi:hypothetical protein
VLVEVRVDLLYENGTLGAHPIDTPVDFSVKLDAKSGDVF